MKILELHNALILLKIIRSDFWRRAIFFNISVSYCCLRGQSMVRFVHQKQKPPKKGLACSSYTTCSQNSKMNLKSHVKPATAAFGLSTSFWGSLPPLRLPKPQTCIGASKPCSGLAVFPKNNFTGSWLHLKPHGRDFGDVFGK